MNKNTEDQTRQLFIEGLKLKSMHQASDDYARSVASALQGFKVVIDTRLDENEIVFLVGEKVYRFFIEEQMKQRQLLDIKCPGCNNFSGVGLIGTHGHKTQLLNHTGTPVYSCCICGHEWSN